MDYEEIKLTDSKELQKLYKGSACTQLGFMPEELHLYINQLADNGFIGENPKVYTYSGKTLNEFIGVPAAFPEDLNVFSISLDDMKDTGKFAVTLRFQMGYRWLDDIVDNKR